MERFFSYVTKTEGCWLFRTKAKTGYGWYFPANGEKDDLAHRVSYRLHKGSIPNGQLVRHSCHVRNCVNPDHLSTGTHKDNHNDMVQAGRAGIRPADRFAKSRQQPPKKQIQTFDTPEHRKIAALAHRQPPAQRDAWRIAVSRSSLAGKCLLTPSPHMYVQVMGRNFLCRKLASDLSGLDSGKYTTNVCGNNRCIMPNHLRHKHAMKPLKFRPDAPIDAVRSRFESSYRINPISGCYEFQGGLRNGYGNFFLNSLGKSIYAHRAAVILSGQTVDHRHLVVHRCGNARCVRLDHLEVVFKQKPGHAVRT